MSKIDTLVLRSAAIALAVSASAAVAQESIDEQTPPEETSEILDADATAAEESAALDAADAVGIRRSDAGDELIDGLREGRGIRHRPLRQLPRHRRRTSPVH